MKNRKTSIFLTITLALCLWVVPVTLTTGCKSGGSVKTQSYKTLKSITESVDTAMKAYADAAVKGLVSPDRQTKVQELHGQYRQVLKLAITTARFDFSQPAPDDLARLAGEISGLIAEIIAQVGH